MIYLIITFEVGQEMTSYPQRFIDRCLIYISVSAMHCEVHRVQSRWKRFKSRWRSLVRLQAFKQLPDTQFHKESLHVFDQPTFEVPFPHFGVESKELKIIGVLEELVR